MEKPRNLRNFWLELNVDGYAHTVYRGPKSHSGGFDLVVKVASHGESVDLLRLVGAPLQNGKNRVILQLNRELSPGEEVLNALEGQGDYTLVLEEPRECKCNRVHDKLCGDKT